MIFEAIIKVNTAGTPEERARDIIDGLGYACALLMDEYELSAAEIGGILEQVADDVTDQELRRVEHG